MHDVYGRKISYIKASSTNDSKAGGTFVSLFCGACSVEAVLCSQYDKVILNDNNKYLIAMWKCAQNGYRFPSVVTESEYKYIREHKDENPALTGFVGFECSFGGKFFGGYARDRKGTNYAERNSKSVAEIAGKLQSAEFKCIDYRDITIPDGSVVYADPPYANTTNYGRKFDSNAFWEYMRKISLNNTVFISEQTAPEDFSCIWEKPLRRTLDCNINNNFIITEKLFIYNTF